jgi:methylated-DNA-protein-cysteine methyltransferase-like protein
MSTPNERLHQRIYQIVRQIPAGRVATYGQIASLVGDCTARMVGYAMASLPDGSDVPWQRVINSQGKISPRGDLGGGAEHQQARLEDEGVRFTPEGKVTWTEVRWQGPPIEWLLANGFDPAPSYTEDVQPGLFGSEESTQ